MGERITGDGRGCPAMDCVVLAAAPGH